MSTTILATVLVIYTLVVCIISLWVMGPYRGPRSPFGGRKPWASPHEHKRGRK
jgi:hypothetical protein